MMMLSHAFNTRSRCLGSPDDPEGPPWYCAESDPCGPRQCINLGLCLDVKVDLVLSLPNGGAESENRLTTTAKEVVYHYRLKEPEQIALLLNLPVNKLTSASVISPRHKVTRKWSQRACLGIPINAVTFAWAHPVMSESNLVSSENDLFCFLSNGGYLYFDKEGKIVKANGVRLGTSVERGLYFDKEGEIMKANGVRLGTSTERGHRLWFEGPYPLADNAERFNRFEADRKGKVTFPGGGGATVTWVLPQEFADCDGGAFVYEYEDRQRDRYMKLVWDKWEAGNAHATQLAAGDLGIQTEWAGQQLCIQSLSDNSPLAAFGLEEGDVILQWDENVITGLGVFNEVYAHAKPHKGITLRVQRVDADGHAGVSCLFFRMKERNWAEDTQSAAPSACGPARPAQTDAPKQPLPLKLVPMPDASIFALHFPGYTIRLPGPDGAVELHGELSAWSAVSPGCGMEPEPWRASGLSQSDCFVFAYPPAAPEPLPPVACAELESLLTNGAWLYFNAGEQTVCAALVVMSQTGPADFCLEFTNGPLPDAALLAQVAGLAQQQELFPLPARSHWRQTGGGGTRFTQLGWTPPFAFGNETRFRFGGFVFADAAGRRVAFGYIKCDNDTMYSMFRPMSSGGPQAEESVQRTPSEAQVQAAELLKMFASKKYDRDDKLGKRQWSLAAEVPYQLRAATAMLALLGRRRTRHKSGGGYTEAVSGRGHYEFVPAERQPPGILDIRLTPATAGQPFRFPGTLQVSAATMEECLREQDAEEFHESLATVGWLFEPEPAPGSGGRPKQQPQVNLREWYKSYRPAAPPAPEAGAEIKAVLDRLSNGGFRLLRNWLFAACVESRDLTRPLREVDNAVLREAAAPHGLDARAQGWRIKLEAADRDAIRDLGRFSVAAICSTPMTGGLEELYGAKTWTLGPEEWHKIHDSTRIYTSCLLPGPFFVRLVEILSDTESAQYWADRSHVFLNEIVTESARVEALLKDVERDHAAFGFTGPAGLEDYKTMLNTPLCALATHVCVAQRGYVLLDEDKKLQVRARLSGTRDPPLARIVEGSGSAASAAALGYRG